MMTSQHIFLPIFGALCFSFCLGILRAEPIAEPAKMSLTGDWTVRVEYRNQTVELSVDPPWTEEVTAEKHDRMPIFNPQRTWNPEMCPNKIRGEEGFPTTYSLDENSLIVRDGAERTAKIYEKGKDYQVLPIWGVVGRQEKGTIPENRPVWLSYRYGKMRIDSVVLTASGKIERRSGVPHIVMPLPPRRESGETLLGNIWIKANITKLEPNLLFPLLETAFPEPLEKTAAESCLPKTMQKLRSGKPLKILAWGDSVTDGSYIKNPEDRWQEQFLRRLQQRFPNAKITLQTEGWGGYRSVDFLAQSPGSLHNFKEKVLDSKPDLVVMEFVNDAGLSNEDVKTHYTKILADFKNMGAEWIILTPHYVRPDWMGLDREREIDEDPRPYVQTVRRFAMENGIAVADAAARYGRLWRQGIPYSTLMSNNINHPNVAGLTIFADALMAIFPQ